MGSAVGSCFAAGLFQTQVLRVRRDAARFHFPRRAFHSSITFATTSQGPVDNSSLNHRAFLKHPMSANYALAAGHIREARSRCKQAAEAIRDELSAADLVNTIEEWWIPRLEMLEGWIKNAEGRMASGGATPRPKIPVT
jgi:hypothetical protein